MMIPNTPLKELYYLKGYIQYLKLECEPDDDDDDFDNPLHEDTAYFELEESS